MSRAFYNGNNSSNNSALINLSNVYEVIVGGFGTGGSKIVSYMTSTTVQFLKQDLITFENLLKDSKWPVSKIIQREVDASRVNEISKNYIENNADSIRYFPPIVVAILPRSADLFSEHYIKYEKNEYSRARFKLMLDRANLGLSQSQFDELLDNDSTTLSKTEGIFIKKPYNENHSYFAWDRDKYFAVVIDGQHRFEALKKSSENANSPYNTFSQDVIFIEGSSKYFSDPSNNTSISIFRKIFIDINKNPVRVSDSKQIIMDDTDPAKLCVQSIVDDTEEDQAKFIQPELIDWNSNSNKHELPYLTGIISLYNIISEKLFDGRSIHLLENRIDINEVKKWVSKMNDNLRVDSEISSQNLPVTSLKDSLESFSRAKANNDDELFTFDYKAIRVAVEFFKKTYRNSFVYYFQKLSIYKELIKALVENRVFDPSSELRIALLKPQINRTDLERNQVKNLKDKLEQSALVKKFHILFTVVGQKALFDLFFHELDSQRAGQLDDSTLMSITNAYVKEQSIVFEELLKIDFNLFGQNDQEGFKEFRNEYFKPLKRYKAISNNFWDDLLYFDNNIKYNKVGKTAIKQIYKYFVDCVKNKNNIDAVQPVDLGYYKNKTAQRLRENYNMSDIEADEVAAKFVTLKFSFIKHLIVSASN